MQCDLDFDSASPETVLSSCNRCVDTVLAKLDCVDRQSKVIRIQQWKQNMQRAARGDKRALHRYLKQERVGAPKFFRTNDGGITADTNQMLEMLSDHMESIYNHHRDNNFQQLEQDFYAKYQHVIDGIACGAVVPPIDHYALFKAFQKKSDLKASGLDGWQV